MRMDWYEMGKNKPHWRDIEGFMLGIVVEPRWYVFSHITLLLGKRSVTWLRKARER